MDGYAMFAYLKDDIVVMCTVLKISYAPAYKNIFDAAVGKIRYRMSWLLKKKKKNRSTSLNTIHYFQFSFPFLPFHLFFTNESSFEFDLIRRRHASSAFALFPYHFAN